MATLLATFRAYKNALATGDCIDRDRTNQELDAVLGELSIDDLLSAVDREPDGALKLLRLAQAVCYDRLRQLARGALRPIARRAAAEQTWSQRESWEELDKLLDRIGKIQNEIIKWETHTARTRALVRT